ncbi:uncharacterized protein DAT39_021556 [Clarias magur]|uniref:F-box domain-containing protein n=1 Tax=Clarias magur TaxID=1594786 RepID=A0A8J4U140_CLAMG|nr:uncharacterized protein DAT39_021556 [Clarias magur]
MEAKEDRLQLRLWPLAGLPRQHLSNKCGIFVLMYSLRFATAGDFDFTETDVPGIRRWWCLLLLENFTLRSEEERCATKTLKRQTEKNAQKAIMTPELQLLDLPMEILEMILLDVVLQDGDAAYKNISLTCSSFSAIVNRTLFRQKAHYAWLDNGLLVGQYRSNNTFVHLWEGFSSHTGFVSTPPLPANFAAQPGRQQVVLSSDTNNHATSPNTCRGNMRLNTNFKVWQSVIVPQPLHQVIRC